jgi:hypothetical protein
MKLTFFLFQLLRMNPGPWEHSTSTLLLSRMKGTISKQHIQRQNIYKVVQSLPVQSKALSSHLEGHSVSIKQSSLILPLHILATTNPLSVS